MNLSSKKSPERAVVTRALASSLTLLALAIASIFSGCLVAPDRTYFEDRDSAPEGVYRLGGKVIGLVGKGLVLADNLGEALPVGVNGDFVFARKYAPGATFAVTIGTQPSEPVQECKVEAGTGTIGQQDFMQVVINCSDGFLVGGVASGLEGTATLTLNGTTTLDVSANGMFAFPTALLPGATYDVTIAAQPTAPSQTCVLSNASGAIATQNVNSILLVCTTNSFKIGVTVAGLLGTGLKLVDNGANVLDVAANGSFFFSVPVVSGGTYAVTVQTQPTTPVQDCKVTSGTGVVGGADVNVAVQCDTVRYSVKGTLIGLTATGASVKLRLAADATQDLTLDANGTFMFPTKVPNAQTYTVTVLTQATGQDCIVQNAGGTIGVADVTNVTVRCRYLQSFDATAAGALPTSWSSAAVSGTSTLFKVVNNQAEAGTNSVFVPGSATGVNVGIELVSPPWAATRDKAQLSFRHRYAFSDTGWDGGVLEISIGGAAFTDIIAEGGAFVSGGYNQTMNAVGLIASRQAWTGCGPTVCATFPSTFAAVQVTLPAKAMGKDVKFRWLATGDDASASTGWWIDSIVFEP